MKVSSTTPQSNNKKFGTKREDSSRDSQHKGAIGAHVGLQQHIAAHELDCHVGHLGNRKSLDRCDARTHTQKYIHNHEYTHTHAMRETHQIGTPKVKMERDKTKDTPERSKTPSTSTGFRTTELQIHAQHNTTHTHTNPNPNTQGQESQKQKNMLRLVLLVFAGAFAACAVASYVLLSSLFCVFL